MKKIKLMDIICIIGGSAIAAFGFHFFLDYAKLVTGGVGGLGIIVSSLFDIDTSYIVLGLNMICLFTGLIVIGKEFFYKTVVGSLLFPFFIFLFERIDSGVALTENMMLNVVMGALFLGTGLGVVIRGGGSTGGMDVIQIIISRLTKMPFSICMYLTDGIIVGIGLIAFGIERGLYSIIGLLIIGMAVDKVLFTNTKKVVHIVTSKPEPLKEAIYKTIDRGITVLDGEGGFQGEVKKVLVSVIDAKEYDKLAKVVSDIDQNAFIYITQATEVNGRGFSRAKEYMSK